MTAEADDAFWLTEADPAVDICDPSLTVDDCLGVILPELGAHVDLTRARILEVGCGIGRLTNPVQARYPDARVIGTDISVRFLAVARSGRVAPGRPAYFEADSVGHFTGQDAIYSMAVMQHLDSDRKRGYLHQFGRALRPGGVVVFQYVEGTHSSRCMYDALIGDVSSWCVEAGLTVRRVQHDLLFPRWTWVTATMGGTE